MTKAKVYRADLYGLRRDKYTFLHEHDVSSTPWREVTPQPLYLFAARDDAQMLTVSGFEGRFRFAHTLNGYTLLHSPGSADDIGGLRDEHPRAYRATETWERSRASHPFIRFIRPGIIGAFTEGG